MPSPRTWRPHAMVALAAVLGLTALPAAGMGPSSPGTASAAVTTATALVSLRSIDIQGDGTAIPGWRADTGYDSGDRGIDWDATATGVANAAPVGVYQTVRWSKSFTYRLRELHPGQAYTLRLHMIEDYWGSAGKRVMTVTANGKAALTGLDLFAVAGAHKAVVRDIPVVADAAGMVTLTMTGTTGDASLAGLQILRAGSPATSPAPAAPKALHVAALASRSVSLDWAGDVEASKYTIYRNGRRLAITTDHSYLDLSVTPGQKYTYTVTVTGPTFRTSGSATPVVVTPPANDAPTATGRYITRGGVVVDPSGKIFTAVGANVGSLNTATGRGQANGHAVEAKAWGWNAVRVTYYSSDEFWWTYRSMNGYPALLKQLADLVAEYRKQGIVVVLDMHDTPEDSADPARTLTQMTTFWKDVAAKYKGDSGVWFNLVNEPKALDEDWYELNARLLGAIRGTGATNIALVDAPQWGQDLGSVNPWFVGSRHGYDATMAPRLAGHYGNVVLSQHNYGAYEQYTTAARYGAYADTVKRTGLPLVTGEAGYRLDKTADAGAYALNYAGAIAAFTSNPARHVGTFVWNATHNDGYSLKADGGAFYSGGSLGANLSDMGKRLWALTH